VHIGLNYFTVAWYRLAQAKTLKDKEKNKAEGGGHAHRIKQNQSKR